LKLDDVMNIGDGVNRSNIVNIFTVESKDVHELEEIDGYGSLIEYFRNSREIVQILWYSKERLKEPKSIEIGGLLFHYWEFIGTLLDKKGHGIRIACLSTGQLFIESSRNLRRFVKLKSYIKQIKPEFLNFDVLYNERYGKFIKMEFLIQLLRYNLPLINIDEILRTYNIFRHRTFTDTFMKCYIKKISISLWRCLDCKGDKDFLDLTLRQLIKLYHDKPDQQALKFRNKIAAKYRFKFDEQKQKFVKSKGRDKVEIKLMHRSTGEVFINGKHVCIEVQALGMPVDDIVASKMLALTIPDLRKKVDTITTNDRRILVNIFGK